jgi:cytochrome P450
VGAGLARLETSCALNAVLDRVARMELIPEYRYRRISFFMLRGPQTVDVRFDRIGAEIPGGGV